MKHCEKSNCVNLNFAHNRAMKNWIITLFFLIHYPVSQAETLSEYTKKVWNPSFTESEYLNEGKILAIADVTSNKKIQTFHMRAMALHQKKCTKVIRKLSQLENYSDWISFIKKSTYQEDVRLFTINAEHSLLPFPMIVHILVDRPTKIGKYNFKFPTGMFTGLTGHFEIKEFNGRCLFYGKSFWEGPKTKIPDMIIELFSETLTKMGGEILMRKVR